MAIRFELHGVQHPFKLCMVCSDALGNNCLTMEPGMKNSRQMFICNDHLPTVMHDLGESIIRRIEEEKENGT